MTIEELFIERLNDPSDIGGHLEFMRKLATGLNTIVEFGVRGGNSTAAWLAARPVKLHCHDIAVPARLSEFEHIAKDAGIIFRFTQTDTATLESIPECDLLFLDTLHTGEQLTAELKHAGRVHKFIVFHDTETNKYQGEGGQSGLQGAMDKFLADNLDWKQYIHFSHCNGLTVFHRI